MSGIPDNTIDIGKYRSGRDTAELNKLIAEVWAEALKTSGQRERFAEALGVPADKLDGTKPPIQVKAPAALEPGIILIIGHYALTYVAGPVAISLAKDVAKDALVKLWRMLLQLLRAKKEGVIEE